MDQILQNVGKLEQVGKSNNSVIYKLMNKENKPTGRVLKLVMHNSPDEHQKECQHLHNESDLLSQIRHPSVIRNHGEMLSNVNIKHSYFCALQIELADTDFFDKIAKMYPNPVEPKYIRSAFIQVLNGLDHLHNVLNIVHNDLKLENLFLFKNKVKIADFGFAQQLDTCSYSASEQKENWKNRCKTPLAPEILDLIFSKSESKFSEKKADIFALGISIFQSLFLRAPFAGDHASSTDELFKHFYNGEPEKFWENEEIQSTLKYLNQFEDFRQDCFVDLMNKLFEVDPIKRLNVRSILKHQWFRQVNQESTTSNLASCTQF